MKVFFDTNVYISEALLGKGAETLIAATTRARWRLFISSYVLDELERVLVEDLGHTPRVARLTRRVCKLRAIEVADVESRHSVPQDPADGPILRAAVAAGVDYLVTNDAHLLALNPYESLKIVSMTEYRQLLENEGLL